MTVWTTNDENRYQRIVIDAAFRAQCEHEAEEKARRIRDTRVQAEYDGAARVQQRHLDRWLSEQR